MRVVVHIERLILDGLAPADLDAAQLGIAIEAELGRLLAEGGVSPELMGGGALATLRGGAIDGAARGAGALGAQIAGAVYSGIGNREGRSDGKG